jgi:hypothetical protein
MRVDQGERMADEVRTLVQQPPAGPMQLVEGAGAHPVTTQPKPVMETLHPIHEKPSGGGGRFERVRAHDIADGMIGRMSQPGHDREWATSDGVRDRILIKGYEIQFTASATNQ